MPSSDDFISDDDMAALEKSSPQASPDFISDDDMEKMSAPPKPSLMDRAKSVAGTAAGTVSDAAQGVVTAETAKPDLPEGTKWTSVPSSQQPPMAGTAVMPSPLSMGAAAGAALYGVAGGADAALKGGSVGDIATSAALNAGIGGFGGLVSGGAKVANAGIETAKDVGSAVGNSATGKAVGALASKVTSMAPMVAGAAGMAGHGPLAVAAGAVSLAPLAANVVKAIGSEAAGVLQSAGVKAANLIGTQWMGAMAEAAKRGAQSVAVTHYLLSQQDPGYQQNQADAETQEEK